MKNIFITILLPLLLLSCVGKNEYKPVSVVCESIKIDSTITQISNPELEKTLNTYKQMLDKEMNQVIGKSALYMDKGKPQSLLSNLTADVLMIAGSKYLKEPVDLALMNNGGLRTVLKKGDITIGDMFSIYPFENSMVILFMKGEKIEELFEDLASQGGEGLAGCSFEFKAGELKKLLVGGKKVDKDKIYKLVTIDYLAAGNSDLEVLLDNIKRIDTDITLRSLMINYVQEMTLQNKKITSKIDNRAVAL